MLASLITPSTLTSNGNLVASLLFTFALALGSGAVFMLINSLAEIDSDDDGWVITKIVVSSLLLVSCVGCTIWQIATN